MALVAALFGILGAAAAAIYFISDAFAASQCASVTITASPSSPTTATSASFSFKDTQSGATFLCSLDSAAFANCASPSSYSSLAIGSHTFKVEASSTGTSTSAATSYTWAVEAPASSSGSGANTAATTPAPSITSEPANPTNSTSATFNFTDSKAAATFQCSIDSGAYSSCSSGKTYTGLSSASHTFKVEAIASSVTSSATSYTWTVDTTPPTVTLTFPAVLGQYSTSTWATGCSPVGICGTASDSQGVTGVTVGILQWSTGDYWNGSSFSSSSLVYNTATGTTKWNYGFNLPTYGIYTIYLEATDTLGNLESGISSVFLSSNGQPTAIAASSGTPQSAAVHSAFGSPLVAKVTSSGGTGVSGVSVTFTAPTSGASGTFASCSGGNPSPNECVVTTNASGLATASTFTADSTVGGPYTVSATTTGLSGSANFSLSNTPAAASQLVITSAPVSGAASTSATLGPITVQVQDAYGNPVNVSSNTTVNLSSTSTGGTFASSSGGSSITSVTINSGTSSSSFYYGDSNVGSPKVTGSSGSLTSGSQTESISKATPTMTVAGPASDVTGTAIPTTSVSAVLASGSKPSGAITFTVFGPQSAAPTSCTTGGTSVGTATVSSNGTYHPSAAFTPSSAGDYWWYASYPGDSNNNPAVTVCSASMSETIVSKASPGITVVGPSSDPIGTQIAPSSVTATLSGGVNPTGTITYTVFGPQASAPTACASGGNSVGTATVSGNGTYNPSIGFTPTATGDYWWFASYGGDANNLTVSSTCGTLMSETVVSKASPSLTASGPSTDGVGTAISTSSISSVLASGYNPTGGITFTVFGPQASAPTSCTTGGTTVGTATVSANGTYHPSAAYTPSSAGNYWWYATYAGNSNNNTAASTCGSGMSETVVGKASPTLTATGPSTDSIGTAVSTSSISSVLASGYNPTGTITFTVFGPQASAPTSCTTGGTTVGSATVSANGTFHPSAGYTPTAAGNYWWYASYPGDSNNGSATSTCGSGMSETTVSKASPTLTATGPSTDSLGTAISTSSISSVLASGYNPTGTISFTVFGPQSSAPTSCTTGGTTVGSATVSANGTFHPAAGYTPTTAGNYWWYASYAGDSNNNTAASTCGSGMSETVVAKAGPTITATGPSTDSNGTAISTSSISSVLASGYNPTGTITFTVFGPQASAPTACTTGGTAVGTATVLANGTYHPSAGYTPTTAGNYWWYASYAGDSNNNLAVSTCGATMSETVVAKASPTITATGPAADSVGTAISTSSISSVLASGYNPTGAITFTVFGPQASAPTACTTGGTTVGTATVSANGTFNPSAGYTPTATGNYWWYASYGGNSNNNSAASTCGSGMSETVVAKVSPTLTATGPTTGTLGTAISATSISSVLGSGYTPTGTITITVFGPQAAAPTSCTTGGATVGTVTVSGNGTYHPSAGYTPTAAGNYWWYASYGGNSNNNSAVSTCGSGMAEVVVAKASPTLTATGPASDTAGTPIATTAISSVVASGYAPTGTITITVFGPQASAPTACTTGGTTVGTAAVSGNATYHPSSGYTPGSAGNYWWYASYSGDLNNNTAASKCNSSMSETIVTGAVATKLVITTSPVSGAASHSATLGPIVVQLESAANGAVNATSNTTVTLTSSSTGGVFASTSGGASITTVTISSGSSSTSFYYGDTVAGSPTITAKTGSLTPATQVETINAGTPNSIKIVSGSPQSAQVTQSFAPLVVSVTDAYNNPVSGVAVTFTAPSNGASGSFSNSTSTISNVTNANGQVSEAFAANTKAGDPYQVSASTPGPSAVNFQLTNTPAAASQLVFTSEPSSNQNVTAGASTAFQVTVEDAYGNVETGDNSTAISLALGSNPGSSTLSCGSSATATASAGVASFSCSINLVGTGYTVVATSSPAHGSTTSNSFNIVAGAPFKIQTVSGTSQSETQGGSFSSPLVALVTDAEGNAVPGAVVTYQAPASGASGTFSNAQSSISSPTGNNGEVSEVLTANDTGGTYFTVTASVAGVSTPADFTNLLIGANFTIYGPTGLQPLLPGNSEALNISIKNPNPESITINANAISGVVTSIVNGDNNGSLAACSTSWFSISNGPTSGTLVIPANTTESLSQLGIPQADWPVLSMSNNNVNQDNCVDATLNLGFTGTASGA